MGLGEAFLPFGVDFDAQFEEDLDAGYRLDFFARRHADVFDFRGARPDDHLFVALLGGPDGRLDETRAVGPGFEFVERYLDRVGQFLVELKEDFFADELLEPLVVREVGQLELGIVRFAFGQQGEQRIDEFVEVGVAGGADGQRLELADVGRLASRGVRPFGGRQIGFVDDRDFRDARGAKQAADVAFFRSGLARRIHDVEDGVYALERLGDEVVQHF